MKVTELNHFKNNEMHCWNDYENNTLFLDKKTVVLMMGIPLIMCVKWAIFRLRNIIERTY